MTNSQLRSFLTLIACTHWGVARAAPINSQSILVSAFNNRPEVIEFTRTGTVLQTFRVSPGPGGFSNGLIGDLAMGRDGRIHIFNGTLNPQLTTLTPLSAPGAATYEHHTIADLDQSSDHSGIAIDEARNAIYLNDVTGSGSGSPNGIVQFDSNTFVATRKKSGNYGGLTLGQDGLLYAAYPLSTAGNDTLDVFDPSTFTRLRTVTLANVDHVAYTGLAVDALGYIYCAEGRDFGHRISKFSPDGTRIKSLHISIPNSWLQDLALSPDGLLVTLSQHGDVVITDTNLNSYTSFQNELVDSISSHVAWAVVTIPEPNTAGLLIAGAGVLIGIPARRRR
jgi:hypothetical protein